MGKKWWNYGRSTLSVEIEWGNEQGEGAKESSEAISGKGRELCERVDDKKKRNKQWGCKYILSLVEENTELERYILEIINEATQDFLKEKGKKL